jgi:hypothetical protein
LISEALASFLTPRTSYGSFADASLREDEWNDCLISFLLLIFIRTRQLTLFGASWGKSLLLPAGGDRVCKPLDRDCAESGIAEVDATGLAVIGSASDSVLGVIRGGIV